MNAEQAKTNPRKIQESRDAWSWYIVESMPHFWSSLPLLKIPERINLHFRGFELDQELKRRDLHLVLILIIPKLRYLPTLSSLLPSPQRIWLPQHFCILSASSVTSSPPLEPQRRPSKRMISLSLYSLPPTMFPSGFESLLTPLSTPTIKDDLIIESRSIESEFLWKVATFIRIEGILEFGERYVYRGRNHSLRDFIWFPYVYDCDLLHRR